MRKTLKTVIILLVIIILCGSIVVIVNYHKIDDTFFSFTLVDSLSLLTSIIIGFFLTYIVSVSFQNENKKNEVIVEYLSAIKDDFAYLMQYFSKHRNYIIDENTRSYILTLSKIIDKDVAILYELCKQIPHMKKQLASLNENRRNFHYIATGDLLIVGEKITDIYIEQCMESYYLAKQNISHCKVELFNI